jgi:hypothetical protein
MGYKSTVISKDFYPLRYPHRMNGPLAVVDLEHRMVEKWLLWPELERRLLWLELWLQQVWPVSVTLTGIWTSATLSGIGYFNWYLDFGFFGRNGANYWPEWATWPHKCLLSLFYFFYFFIHSLIFCKSSGFIYSDQ